MIADSYFIKLLLRQYKTNDVQHLLFVFISILTIVSFLQWLIKLYSELRKLPPGPWGFPVIGYLLFMGNEKHTRFMELAKQYGSLFSTRLGNQLTVVMSDYKMIRECFRREEFTGRPDTPFMQTLNGFGIINSTGKLWKDQRRFLHEKLRQFGMTYMGNGKHIMEKRIMTEVHEYIHNLRVSDGQPMDMAPAISVAVSNVICSIMMSVRFSIDDPKFRRFNFLIEEGMRLFGEIHTVDYIPTVQYFPSILTAKNKIAKNREEMQKFYQDVIDDHKKTYDPSNVRDLVDFYLAEIEKAKSEGRDEELFDGKNHEEQIVQVIIDLFSAGMETIKTTLLWINVFMLRNPEVMRRVQDELDQVVGRHRLPSIEDLQYLPVTESTILESMRRSSIVPLATTHSPTRDVEVNGYKIPAGSHVIPLINSVHMDPNLWDKPEEFNPRRFLDSEGKVRKPEYFIPFGVGRRMCLGDVLARMELFLFFASFMHCFNITLPEGQPLPSLKGNVGATITPESFKVCLTPRPLVLNSTVAEPHHMRNVGSN
ncbi:cytochrome P450 18a1 [Teleopsis dalmanni]|uniref:cytochrome P450 18a1 n=1 Tax=Teleopsis dalmanni TaxID=139649 RepID=UPI0018CE72E4|nr:cytochrome P450 18a1 [Teleopsis dalmanni]